MVELLEVGQQVKAMKNSNIYNFSFKTKITFHFKFHEFINDHTLYAYTNWKIGKPKILYSMLCCVFVPFCFILFLFFVLIEMFVYHWPLRYQWAQLFESTIERTNVGITMLFSFGIFALTIAIELSSCVDKMWRRRRCDVLCFSLNYVSLYIFTRIKAINTFRHVISFRIWCLPVRNFLQSLTITTLLNIRRAFVSIERRKLHWMAQSEDDGKLCCHCSRALESLPPCNTFIAIIPVLYSSTYIELTELK